MQTYTGGCHCGAVRFEAEADVQQAIECNCSHCSMKGLVLTFIPASQFKLLSGEDHLKTYLFNKKAIEHQFCSECGVESFARGTSKDGSATVSLNVRCLDSVDVSQIPKKPFDGKSW